jgi:hypothetical protein
MSAVDYGEELLQRAITDLAEEFAGVFSPGTIERCRSSTSIRPSSRQ